jgi:hypothetical protein
VLACTLTTSAHHDKEEGIPTPNAYTFIFGYVPFPSEDHRVISLSVLLREITFFIPKEGR